MPRTFPAGYGRILLVVGLLATGIARAGETSAPAPPSEPAVASPAPAPAKIAAEKKAPAFDGPTTNEIAEEKAAERGGFVKGELSSLGATNLQVKNTRVGLRAGATKIGTVYYLVGSLEFDLNWKKLAFGLAAPARIPLWDPNAVGGLKNSVLPEGLTLRKEDYDEASEILRLVRYVKWGTKEAPLYVNLGTETSATIGHGQSVRRYLANIDVDRGRLSGEVDAYGRYGGGELFVGDLLRPDRMLAAMAFVKPFGGSQSLMLERFSVGLTFAADFSAPYALERDAGGRPVIPSDPAVTTKTPNVSESRAAQIIGLSVETKVYKSESADLKPYFEASKLIGGGAGVTLGGLGRFAFGHRTKFALRTILELRAFQGNFLPGYFDTFYEVQRFQYITGAAAPLIDQPKLFDVLSRPADLTLGYYTEVQFALVDWFALTGAWEDSKAKGGRNLVLHAEIPTWARLRLFASLHRRSVEGSLLDFGTEATGLLKADNTLVFAGARFKVLPILYVNARAFRGWKMDVDSASYRNIDGFEVDVEVGYEFSRD